MSDRPFEDEEQQGPTVRDKRRIDPDTYQVREPQPTAAAPGPGGEAPVPEATQTAETVEGDVTVDDVPVQETENGEVAALQTQLAERTADLQRLQAEYVNYKRRVDRDRDVARVNTIETVMKDFLSVVDDLASARQHEELTGGFKAVAEEIERVTAKYGVVAFGQPGDAFDPHIHEALLHAHADGITGPTCVQILQPGYRIGEKVLRPARVAVAEPDPNAPASESAAAAEQSEPSVDEQPPASGQ